VLQVWEHCSTPEFVQSNNTSVDLAAPISCQVHLVVTYYEHATTYLLMHATSLKVRVSSPPTMLLGTARVTTILLEQLSVSLPFCGGDGGIRGALSGWDAFRGG